MNIIIFMLDIALVAISIFAIVYIISSCMKK